MKVDTSGNTTWQKAYGETGYAYYQGVAGGFTQTVSGEYAIGGSITDSATNNSDVLLMRFNSKVDTLWTKTYGGNDFDAAFKCIQTDDGGFILIGQQSIKESAWTSTFWLTARSG